MKKNIMVMRESFEDRDTQLNFLASQLKCGRLALVLGAGVSQPMGLPEWPNLVDRLFASKGSAPPAGNIEITLRADQFRSKYYANDFPGYIKSIRAALYDGINFDFKDLRHNDTLAAIAALVMASNRRNTSKVITFNWDNLLEVYLAYHGFMVSSVFQDRHWNSNADVTIYHPHGFVPNGSSEHSEHLIFDRRSYSEVTGKAEDFWNQHLITIMRTHTCLFIGLSGEDPRLDSHIISCQKDHISLKDRNAFWSVSFSRKESEADYWESRSIYCNKLTDWKELPEMLFTICQKAAKI
jgi:SIR2-like domain